jgi:hypothetical protein
MLVVANNSDRAGTVVAFTVFKSLSKTKCDVERYCAICDRHHLKRYPKKLGAPLSVRQQTRTANYYKRVS